MGVDTLPEMEIRPIELSVEEANAKGYGAWATVFYDPSSDTYQMDVWKDIYPPQMHADYVLFHEFTHALDIEQLAKRDKMKYAKIRGYMEYHASQVELMKQLGARTFTDHISFSMDDIVKGITADKSVAEILRVGKKTATDLIQRIDFPTDLDMLLTTMSIIFNHLGRLSICQQYAKDYEKYESELTDFQIEESMFGSDAWKLISALMKGFMSEDAIRMEMDCHFGIVVSIMKKYGLD